MMRPNTVNLFYAMIIGLYSLRDSTGCQPNSGSFFNLEQRRPFQNYIFTINTCNPCAFTQQRSINVLNACNWGSLLRIINETITGLEQLSEQLEFDAPSARGELCYVSHHNFPVPQSNSIDDVIFHYYRIVSNILLRLSVIDFHDGDTACQNLMLPLLCKMKTLLRGTTLPANVYQHRLQIEDRSTTAMILFKCENLKRASSLLRHLKRDIVRAIGVSGRR